MWPFRKPDAVKCVRCGKVIDPEDPLLVPSGGSIPKSVRHCSACRFSGLRYFTTWEPEPPGPDERIASALERIADALDTQEKTA